MSAESSFVPGPYGELTDFTKFTQPGGREAEDFRNELGRGDFSGLRSYLTRTRAEQDWKDRVLILREVVSFIPLAALDFACEMEPNSAELFLIRSAFYADHALSLRGTTTVDKVPEERWRHIRGSVSNALAALELATQLDAGDPTGRGCVVRALRICADTWPHLQQAFLSARKLAPDLAAIYEPMITVLSKRWGGSNEKSVEFARGALRNLPPGTDVPFCLFYAHLLAQTHFLHFDGDTEGSENYLHNAAVSNELNATFDEWIRAPYVARRSSVPYLQFAAMWYYQQGDRERLKTCFSMIGDRFCKVPWYSLGKAEDVFRRARMMAAGRSVVGPTKLEALDKCLAGVNLCLRAANEKDWKRATVSLAVALEKARVAPPEQEPYLSGLVLLNASWLSQKMGKARDATDCKDRAFAKLDGVKTPLQSTEYQYLLAESLERLAEYRRAIPCWEQSLLLSDQQTDVGKLVRMLHRMGEDYLKAGLSDHALMPLRAALKICRKFPGEPSTAVVLNALGNSLRLSVPSEAESYYREAASIHESNLRPLSAAPMWVNLGILCSKQGRHEESLEYLRKALRVREQSPGVSKAALASVQNSLANTYRRMGRFTDAHASIDRAITLLSGGDRLIASAYGTRGLIYEDAGDDKRAVEWLRRSREDRERQSSPNLADMLDDSEHELAALRRLGRGEEATSVEQRISDIRTAIATAPQLDAANLDDAKAADCGAVMIEMHLGIQSPEIHEQLNAFRLRMVERVKAYAVGQFQSRVSIPESTTLVFSGPDAGELYRALEPVLFAEPIAAGGTVRIRENGSLRALMIPLGNQAVN